MTARDAVRALDSRVQLPGGEGDRFAGYALVGQPFASGHVLALRCFTASSLGVPYTSVWHRDPAGGWTFYSTAAPDVSCARYFGRVITRNVVTGIDVTWNGPFEFRVTIDDMLDWRVTVARSAVTSVLAAIAAVMPRAMWDGAVSMRWTNDLLGAVLRTGPLAMDGCTPNGHRFSARPTRIWMVQSSQAVIGGVDLGGIGCLLDPASLGDVTIPQRGVLALVRSRMQAPAGVRRGAATFGRPCSSVRQR